MSIAMPGAPAGRWTRRPVPLASALFAAAVCFASIPATRAAEAMSAAGEVPAAAAPTLGAHTLLGQEDGYGANPAVTAPIDTQASGSSFLVFNAGHASNTDPPTDNKGNAWSPLGAPVVYHGYDGAYDLKAYTALGGHGGAGHVVSIVKNGNSSGELTLPFIEVRNAAVIADSAEVYADAAPQVSSGSVTTTGPAVLVALWWGDGFYLQQTAVPDNGFTVADEFLDLPPNSAVQCVVAYRQVAAAGTWRVSWTQAPAQGAILWLIALQAQGGDGIFANGFE
ncbi:MAG: hypothetical protein J0H15_08955 [Xanthomonadales bacterium]|nr:hypothetical protein [Xanthomonadales bacterium]